MKLATTLKKGLLILLALVVWSLVITGFFVTFFPKVGYSDNLYIIVVGIGTYIVTRLIKKYIIHN